MALRMESLRIEGFKAIGDATLYWHPHVNVITGANNSGKTTVLEALALWVEAFQRIACQAGKTNNKRGVNRNDWYLDTAHVHHSEIVAVRSPAFEDLFHRDASVLTLTASFRVDKDEAFAIPLQIRKARGGHYEISCNDNSPALMRALNTHCVAWPRPFRAVFAAPTATVATHEEFCPPGKVGAMIHERRSVAVLRNRIHRLHSTPAFQGFTDNLRTVLGTRAIEFEVKGDPNRDVYVEVLARTSPHDSFRDISVLGSGSLQIIEVLLDLYLDSADFSVLLLDEPDSHIHRDIQRRLLAVIEGNGASQVQVFATTHNEAFVRSVPWDRVFHLQSAPAGTPREFRPLGDSRTVALGRHRGLIASPLHSALAAVGGETALDLLNALEASQFLLVEGSHDAAVIDHIFEIGRLGTPKVSAMYWSLGGFDAGLRSLAALRSVLECVRNDRSLWAKACIVLDRDLLTEDQARSVAAALTSDYKVRVLFWAARTAEAALLSGGPSATVARALAAVARELASRLGEHDDLDEASLEACRQAWVELQQRLARDRVVPLDRLLPALEQRKQLLAEVVKNSPLTGPMGKLQQQVDEFLSASVAAGRLWDVADKTIVKDFVNDVFTRLGLTQEETQKWSGPNWFDMILGHVRDLGELPALQEMREALRQPLAGLSTR